MLNLNQFNALTSAFASFALAGLNGAATTHSHAVSLPFAINGAFGTAPTGTTTPTTNSAATRYGSVNGPLAAGTALSVTAPATGFRAALVVWTLDASGTKRIRSNGFYTSLGGEALALEFPDIPATEVAVAYHTVRAASTLSGTWTYGSSNWNVAGITIGTVVNLANMPAAGTVSVS